MAMSFDAESVSKFQSAFSDDQHLLPVIVQDDESDEVLMLAYLNRSALDQTLETGRATYFSRSRNQIWVKGDTSGHKQWVRSISFDCDSDALLFRVQQEGVACHTGQRSCFHRKLA
jgi:phosphoribosyl-AMP cyclohydrolase